MGLGQIRNSQYVLLGLELWSRDEDTEPGLGFVASRLEASDSCDIGLQGFMHMAWVKANPRFY